MAGVDQGILAESPWRLALILPLGVWQGAGWETGCPDTWQEGADRLPGTEKEPRGVPKMFEEVRVEVGEVGPCRNLGLG